MSANSISREDPTRPEAVILTPSAQKLRRNDAGATISYLFRAVTDSFGEFPGNGRDGALADLRTCLFVCAKIGAAPA
ncbi:hypothetical protein GCM10007874_31980 [Labrys miyagiensis]|uniref:Uncharacterized protein n=1 Tax=Labrys miyagiensis TaxID=346912 RepID=A0ABQ6CPM8_9HYPH|nr:hypothetical protein GCM10007874_31980 [Labrys miyagiensis]